MGIFKAFGAAVSGSLNDQWKVFFYCDAIPNNTLIVRGVARGGGQQQMHSSEKGHVISDGSIICVPTGAAAIVVSNGKVTHYWTKPGEHIFDSKDTKSIFSGAGLKSIGEDIGNRIAFGGDIPVSQHVYYVNTKEIMNQSFCSSDEMPVRIVDEKTGLDMDCSMRLNGTYSMHVSRPDVIYRNMSGSVTHSYYVSDMASQVNAELRSVLRAVLGEKLWDVNRLPSIVALTDEISREVTDRFNKEMEELRGVRVSTLSLTDVNLLDSDRRKIQDLQRLVPMTNPQFAAATLINAQIDAMKVAAANGNGGVASGVTPVMTFDGGNSGNMTPENMPSKEEMAAALAMAQQQANAQMQANVQQTNAQAQANAQAPLFQVSDTLPEVPTMDFSSLEKPGMEIPNEEAPTLEMPTLEIPVKAPETMHDLMSEMTAPAAPVFTFAGELETPKQEEVKQEQQERAQQEKQSTSDILNNRYSSMTMNWKERRQWRCNCGMINNTPTCSKCGNTRG